MKKFCSMALTILLLLSLSAPAFAAPLTQTGTLTIHSNRLPAGATINAYLMFSATLESTEENPVIGAETTAVEYTLNSVWAPFFWLSTDGGDATGKVDLSTLATANPTLDKGALAQLYISSLSAEEMVKFAEAATVFATDAEKTDGVTPVTKDLHWSSTNVTSGQGTIENLPSGYYLVDIVGQKSEGLNNRGSDAMLVNIPSDTPTTDLWVKNERPTLRKLVRHTDGGAWDEDGAYEIGDEVPFQVTVKVPDFKNYKHYTFIFQDTLSIGLDYIEGSAMATIPVEKSEEYPDGVKTLTLAVSRPVAMIDEEDDQVTGNTISMEVVNFLDQLDESDIGKDITLTYRAILNDKAQWEATGNLNEIKAVYSTNPAWNGDGDEPLEETPVDTAFVYTFEIEVHKYWEEIVKGENGESETVQYILSGATFRLYDHEPTAADTEDTAIDLFKVSDTVYHVHEIEPDDHLHTATQKYFLSTSENVMVMGLKEGIYYLVETDAPFGYNKLADPVKIEISYVADEMGHLKDVIYYVNDAKSDNHKTIDIENKKGAVLPETGGVGTVGLTAFGLAVAFLGWSIPKKKDD